METEVVRRASNSDIFPQWERGNVVRFDVFHRSFLTFNQNHDTSHSLLAKNFEKICRQDSRENFKGEARTIIVHRNSRRILGRFSSRIFKFHLDHLLRT